MYKFTVNVKSTTSGYTRATIEAQNIYEATQQAKAIYGDKLMGSPYSPVRV